MSKFSVCILFVTVHIVLSSYLTFLLWNIPNAHTPLEFVALCQNCKIKNRTQSQTEKELYHWWVFTPKWWKFSFPNYFNFCILERHWLKFSLLRPRHASKIRLLWNDPEENIFCLIAFFNVYIFFYLSCLFAELSFFLLDANKKLVCFS